MIERARAVHSTQSKRWRIAPQLPPDQAAPFQNFHPVVAQILFNRGFTDPGRAETFLLGQTPAGDPFKMHGMNKAIGRIRLAIKKNEPIVIYGDFDADGVTSTTLLVSVLKALGANVRPYIPHRVDEGYGLNDEALRKLAAQGAKLVITVDCGIRSLHEVDEGKQAGLDMIITDHHSVGPDIPAAYAVINPKQPDCKYGEKMLAGVGIAYKVADALLKAAKQDRGRNIPIQTEDLLDLVAIGTVADLAPLSHGENRALVMQGLEQLRQSRRIGIRALLEVARLAPDQIDAGNIGFVIGPRINAAGRLGSAMTAYHLLLTDDPQSAAEHARQLQDLNAQRQALTKEAQERVRSILQLDTKRAQIPSLIFAIDTNFPPGIVGLVAGRLTEEYYRPSIVLHRGEQESHGSCRSIAEFNITEALDRCADLLIRHGGHAQAAGFAINNENLPHFEERIGEIVTEGLEGKDLRPQLEIDSEVELRQLDMRLYDDLRKLEPCGAEYPAPVLCARRLRVADCRTVGDDNAHLKLKLSDGRTEIDAIGFRLGARVESVRRASAVDVAFQLDLNEWNGSRRLQLKVQDVHETTG